MGFNLTDQILNRVVLQQGAPLRGQRPLGHLRRTKREIDRGRADRQEQQPGQGGGAPSPERRSIGGRLVGLRRIGGGDQPARDLDFGSIRLGLADQAGCAVTRDLVELIAIDRDVAAAGGSAAPAQRP